jgi:hypothetical protein
VRCSSAESARTCSRGSEARCAAERSPPKRAHSAVYAAAAASAAASAAAGGAAVRRGSSGHAWLSPAPSAHAALGEALAWRSAVACASSP